MDNNRLRINFHKENDSNQDIQDQHNQDNKPKLVRQLSRMDRHNILTNLENSALTTAQALQVAASEYQHKKVIAQNQEEKIRFMANKQNNEFLSSCLNDYSKFYNQDIIAREDIGNWHQDYMHKGLDSGTQELNYLGKEFYKRPPIAPAIMSHFIEESDIARFKPSKRKEIKTFRLANVAMQIMDTMQDFKEAWNTISPKIITVNEDDVSASCRAIANLDIENPETLSTLENFAGDITEVVALLRSLAHVGYEELNNIEDAEDNDIEVDN